MSIKTVRLFNSFINIVYLYIKNSLYLSILLFLVFVMTTRDPLVALQLILLFIFYMCIHEFGHIVFLVNNGVDYKLNVTNFSVSVSFDEIEFSKITVKVKLGVILGGPLFGLLYCGGLIYAFHDIKHILYFSIIVVVCEVINIILGQDGRMLEQLIKERV